MRGLPPGVPSGQPRRRDLLGRIGLRGLLCGRDAPGRAVCHRPEDAHHAAGIACVDEAADPVSRALVRQHGLTRAEDARVRLGDRGTPLWNLRWEEGWVLDAKDGRRSWKVPATPADPDHEQPGHERLSCTACHAGWAPTCTSCHTRRDASGEQWDFGAGDLTPGAWVERHQGQGTALPVLAVAGDRIVPAVPGMIWTLERPDGSTRTARRFAALDPHTTHKAARSCASCHASERAVGAGVPLYPASPGQGTRQDVRSLNAAEQRRVLGVGTR